MDSDGIIEKVPAHGDHLFVLLQKLMDHRVSTINKFLVRETWPMPNIEFHTDTVGCAKFITVCDVQSAY